MSTNIILQIIGIALLAAVWITEVFLVRALQRAEKRQADLNKTVGRVEGALDSLSDKLVKISKRLGS